MQKCVTSNSSFLDCSYNAHSGLTGKTVDQAEAFGVSMSKFNLGISPELLPVASDSAIGPP